MALCFKDVPRTPYYVLKSGEIEAEYCAMAMFRIFNMYWLESVLALQPCIRTYQVIPIATRRGFTEFAAIRAQPFQDLDFEKFTTSISDAGLLRLQASLAGAFLAAFILGVFDKHSQELLIENETLFYYDFEQIFQEGLQGRFHLGIPKRIRELFVQKGIWEHFKSLCFDGLKVLQHNSDTVVYFTSQLMKSFRRPKEISLCMRRALSVEKDVFYELLETENSNSWGMRFLSKSSTH